MNKTEIEKQQKLHKMFSRVFSGELTQAEASRQLNMDRSNFNKGYTAFKSGIMTDAEEAVTRKEISLNIKNGTINRKRAVFNSEVRKLSLTEAILENHVPKDVIATVNYKAKVNEAFGTNFISIGDLHYEDYKDDKEFIRFFAMVKDYIIKNFKGQKVNIIFGGDFVESNNHIGQLAKGMIKVHQYDGVRVHILGFLEALIKEDIVDPYVYIVAGNHDRTNRGYDEVPPTDSFAYLIYKEIQRRFKGIQIEYDYLAIDKKIDGLRVLITHGDRARGAGSDAVINWVRNREGQIGINYDLVFVYHSHKFKIDHIKGTNKKIIFTPAAKPEINENEFEIENNQRSTVGFLGVSIGKNIERIDRIKTGTK